MEGGNIHDMYNNQQICRSFSKIFRFVILFKHYRLTMLNSCKNIDHAIDVKKEKKRKKEIEYPNNHSRFRTQSY